ncbi:SPW repeat protein [Nocardia stercoris]|uniref:SPW repeat-containing integral membrane domain-containing protein n=1 Tax=Nocardia stercoris TaxID=2483361 RepID=A0A3M2KZR6_9NOCA|nr:SPW repeat protein [Nocardia stercoris]RMI30969.1 hypothetical protein EBN03_20300 [Nocardia stercoris]
MFNETRAADSLAVILGILVAISPSWLDHSTRSMWTMIVLGALIALTGLAQMARPAMTELDYAMGLFGVLLFIAPWVMNYHDLTGSAWWSWIVGVITVLAALAAMPQMTGRMHTAH